MRIKKIFLSPYIVWILGFVILPLVAIFYYAFFANKSGFTFNNVLLVAKPENLKALGISFVLSLFSTILCLVIAFPLCYIINSSKIKSKRLVVFLLILPMWMNSLLRTLAWQTVLEKNGILNAIFQSIGIGRQNMINTYGAIIVGMVYNFLPFMILPIYNSLEKIDKDIINAAKDLGASKKDILLKILLPLVRPGMESGIVMVFIPALTTFVISDILGGGKILLLGNIIEQEFKLNYRWDKGSGLSVILMCFILITFALTSKDKKTRDIIY